MLVKREKDVRYTRRAAFFLRYFNGDFNALKTRLAFRSAVRWRTVFVRASFSRREEFAESDAGNILFPCVYRKCAWKKETTAMKCWTYGTLNAFDCIRWWKRSRGAIYRWWFSNLFTYHSEYFLRERFHDNIYYANFNFCKNIITFYRSCVCSRWNINLN